MHKQKRGLLQEPSRQLVEYVVGRFDPDPDAGELLVYPVTLTGEIVTNPNDALLVDATKYTEARLLS